MSLAVKKEIETLKPEIDRVQNEMKTDPGVNIEFDFDWASFHTPQAVAALKSNCLMLVWADLRNMCSDATCKEAVSEGVKKVHVVQDDAATKGSMELKDKVLTLKTEWVNQYFSGLSVKSFLLENL